MDSGSARPPFGNLRREFLEDGRELIVQYQGERYGWGCYLQRGGGPTTSADTPEAAIVEHLGLDPSAPPEWVVALSRDYMEELELAPRFLCNCCGYRTLLSEGEYEICDVCGWEDDSFQGPPNIDQPLGPNRTTLRVARKNFAAFGASEERCLQRVRGPREEAIDRSRRRKR